MTRRLLTLVPAVLSLASTAGTTMVQRGGEGTRCAEAMPAEMNISICSHTLQSTLA
jgi:hypothetical protein